MQKPFAALALIAALALPAAAQVCDGVAPVDTGSIRSVPVITGVPNDPLLVVSPPGDTDRLFVVTQGGVIYLWKRGNASNQYTVFLDLSLKVEFGGEQGLLSMAFAPDYATSRTFYVNYSRRVSGDTIVARVLADINDPDVADPLSERVVLTIQQPEGNHNGGMMHFGPDGYLYIATGDGGGGGDDHGQCGNGLDTSNLLGKILRIDPTQQAGGASDCAGGTYTVPANPLSDGPGGDCDEIYMYGLRNPWRFSIDDNGDFLIGDVGQFCWEELNYIAAADAGVGADGSGAQNLGWRSMEGFECFDPDDSFNCSGAQVVSCGTTPSCGDASLTLPVDAFSDGCSVVAGWFYRGCRLPQFEGKAFFGDYCDVRIRTVDIVGGAAVNEQDWESALDPGGALAFSFSSFGRDGQGELYLIDQGGTISKIVPPFDAAEVSGAGGTPFLIDPNGGWSWEDVTFETMVPVDFYRVYRGLPAQTFDCIHASDTPDWGTGDTLQPAPDELLAYIVTAVDTNGVESSSGTPERLLSNPCPAP